MRLKRRRIRWAHRCRTGRARATGRVCRWRSRLDEVTYRAQVPFVYHLCAEDFRGPTIYPLHRLRDEHPDIYELERPKWAGRESVLNFVVPHLGVPWGDTVNLAALDPLHLVAARRRLGLAYTRLLERRVVRIPVERLAGRDAVIYDSRSHWLNSRPGQNVPASPPEDDSPRSTCPRTRSSPRFPNSTSTTWPSKERPVSRHWRSSSFATFSSLGPSTSQT
jgi:hypothetical protein